MPARRSGYFRYPRLADAPKIDRKLHALKPILKGAQIEVRGGLNRPPLERTSGVRELFRHAQSLMQEIDVPLGEASTGGGSDGNFTSALGVPTLDGLGAIGDGAHRLWRARRDSFACRPRRPHRGTSRLPCTLMQQDAGG